MPGLGHIPIIGELFKSRAFDSTKRELVIFAVPSHGVRDVIRRAARAALGLVGLAVLAAFTAVFVRRPELVTLTLLVVAPLRLPFDFGGSHRLFVGLAQNGEIGRLLSRSSRLLQDSRSNN